MHAGCLITRNLQPPRHRYATLVPTDSMPLLELLVLYCCVSASALVHGPTTRTISTLQPRHSQPRLILPVEQHLEPVVAAAITTRLRFVGSTLPVFSAAVSTRGKSGLPQIVQSIREQEPPPARSTGTGDALVYMSRIIYHARMGFPIAMWSELVLLLLQNLACLGLRSRFSKSDARQTAVQLATSFGCLSLAALAMMRLPSRLMPLLCLWTVPLALFSYGQQAFSLAARGAIAPAPASSSVLLRWISSSVRVCTTLVFLGADLPVLAKCARWPRSRDLWATARMPLALTSRCLRDRHPPSAATSSASAAAPC